MSKNLPVESGGSSPTRRGCWTRFVSRSPAMGAQEVWRRRWGTGPALESRDHYLQIVSRCGLCGFYCLTPRWADVQASPRIWWSKWVGYGRYGPVSERIAKNSFPSGQRPMHRRRHPKKNTKQTVPIRFSIYLVLAKSGNWRFSLIERSFTYRLIKRGDKGFCFGGPSLSSLPNVFAQNNNVMGV